jgi:16S rRNA (uracil1498-N3)-methyltransferase
MYLFYTNDIRGQQAFLDEEEARHCLQVLRHKVGDLVHCTDGQGTRFEGRITALNKKGCTLQMEQEEKMPLGRNWQLHLAMAPTKNADRTEWLIEKAVEIGVDTFTPLWCERSERKNIRMDRLEKIALSAMKQSLSMWLPRMEAPLAFSDFLERQTGSAAQLFIAHCMEDAGKVLLQHKCAAGRDVCILIGPEGDFSPAEVQKALKAGFEPVSLGTQRLRTETAALSSCLTIHFVNNQ